jgi:hypothetical protein
MENSILDDKNVVHMKKQNRGFSGRRHTQETKLLMSESRKGSKNAMYGRPAWNRGKKQKNKQQH